MQRKIYMKKISLILILFFLSNSLQASNIGAYKEFYLSLHKNAFHKYIFCNPTTKPTEAPLSYGVLRDTLNRITEFTRFSFGNVESHSDWAITRISYLKVDSIAAVVERRSFYNAMGKPIGLGWVHIEELLISSRTGNLLQRRLFRTDGVTNAGDSAKIHEYQFRFQKGIITQSFYNYNGRMCHGEKTEQSMQSLHGVPYSAFYRKFRVDSLGNAIEESMQDLYKKPVKYDDSVVIRKYEFGDCGRLTKQTFFGADSLPMPNSDGVFAESYAYDESGRLVEIKFLDKDNKLQERLNDKVAIIKYKFREFDGVLISTSYFNKKEEQI